MSPHAPVITVLFDNLSPDPNLTPAHGFSCLIEGREETVLFDTGLDTHILLANMKALAKDPKAITTVVISHIHFDHSGGLFGLLQETGIRPRIVVPKSMYEEFIDHAKGLGCAVVVVDEPTRINAEIRSTGQVEAPNGLRDFAEHALIVDSGDGPVMITGCAHPGIVKLTRRAADLGPEAPTTVLGGFHLRHDGEDEVDDVIDALKKIGVKRVGTSHCTGRAHAERFQQAWGDGYVPFTCGAVVELAPAAP